VFRQLFSAIISFIIWRACWGLASGSILRLLLIQMLIQLDRKDSASQPFFKVYSLCGHYSHYFAGTTRHHAAPPEARHARPNATC
jgi:hypothetical protein